VLGSQLLQSLSRIGCIGMADIVSFWMVTTSGTVFVRIWASLMQAGRKTSAELGEAAKLIAESGIIAICSLISPFSSERDRLRQSCAAHGIPFAEVFINTPLEVCEQRDAKGLYKRARLGEIKMFTGIDSPYEAPERPELVIYTDKMPIEQCVSLIGSHVHELTAL
jgi:adenylylsulfate kinase-like enzyme